MWLAVRRHGRRSSRIGISGWRYAPWRAVFYARDLPQKRELEYASCRLPTIEINGSFYWLQRQVADAHRASPRDARARARRDVFVYFDNDVKVRAPYDAETLIRKVAGC